MPKTYIIGDVHGNLKTLKALIKKLDDVGDIIFVGDLVDRGKDSAGVISFIRENNYKCVLGNHEEMMIDFGSSFIKHYPKHPYINYYLSSWLYNGGKETLLSYDLAYIDKYDKKLMTNKNEEALKKFTDDIEWFKTLPLYIELDIKKEHKPVVVSHSNVANVWHFREDKKNQEVFREYALWKRISPRKDVDIFNIFGHTPIEKIDTKKHYINLDTGCYINNVVYAKLSAYCIESNEVISIRRVDE